MEDALKQVMSMDDGQDGPDFVLLPKVELEFPQVAVPVSDRSAGSDSLVSLMSPFPKARSLPTNGEDPTK